MLVGHLPELLIVLTLALVVFGPKRLPEIGSSLGKGIRDFRQSLSQLDAEGPQHPAPIPVEQHPIALSESRSASNHKAS
jgi:sec-independent protein translocase protein TatA